MRGDEILGHRGTDVYRASRISLSTHLRFVAFSQGLEQPLSHRPANASLNLEAAFAKSLRPTVALA